jgi:hypothetical protein
MVLSGTFKRVMDLRQANGAPDAAASDGADAGVGYD